jgi:hypothetical protein
MDELILRPGRLKILAAVIVGAGIAVNAAFELRTGVSGPLFAGIGIVGFGGGAIAFSLLLLPNGAYLKLDSGGFTACSLFRTHRYRWLDVERFEARRIGWRELVGFNLSKEHRSRQSAPRLSWRVVGFDGGVPAYGMSAQELAALMNEWRQRYASR